MITLEQLKRVTSLASEKKELQEILDGFTPSKCQTRIGLVTKYENSIGSNDSAARFNYMRKDLINRLNTIVIDALNEDIKKIDLQLAEHISS